MGFLIWNPHNVFVSSFWFIWIPMLWVYGHKKYFYSNSSGIDFDIYRRQILTAKVDHHSVRASISHSFEDWIADVIYSFKWRKID